MYLQKGHLALLPFVGSLLLCLCIGYMIGRIANVQLHAQQYPMALTRDTRPLIPVVAFQGIADGKLQGNVKGDVRVFVGDDIILTEDDGTFAVSPGPLAINNISVLIPEGMHFVASRRGKKYYPVLSKSGEKIVPENRVYFRTRAEAEEAGFRS